MASRKSKTICVYSSKGGVGKTTTVLNMAGIYENVGKKVLIVDFDLANGGIALALDKGIDKTIYNLYDDLNNGRFTVIENYITKFDEYIDYLAAPKDPRQSVKIDSKYIDLIFEQAGYIYDVILIDTTHTLNEINICLLDKCDYIVYLLYNDLYNLKNMRSVINIFNDLGIKKYKVVLNNSINRDKKYYSAFDIKNVIGCNIDYIIPESFYMKNFDIYLSDREIFTLSKSTPTISSKGVEIISLLALSFISETEEKIND